MKLKPIFITGRFRSGTSYFWHIFNQLAGYKAWYEPLHPQLLSHIKYTQPKTDHVNIKDYWAAYRPLNQLGDYYDSRLGSERLLLTAQDSWPELRQYIDYLMAASGDKQPVLQFNRMDFRLPWLVGFYPSAQTLYLKRNPIQLWCSQRKHIPQSQRNIESYADAYELMQWCADLSPLLPFLAPHHGRHAFYRFYVLYRLSVIMGAAHADVVIDLDEDVFNSNNYLDKLKGLGLDDDALKTALKIKHIPEPYEVSEEELALFSAITTEVDALLERSGLTAHFADRTINEIKKDYPQFWQQQRLDAQAVITELNQGWHQEQVEKIKLISELDQCREQSKDNE